jgi:amino acid permease
MGASNFDDGLTNRQASTRRCIYPRLEGVYENTAWPYGCGKRQASAGAVYCPRSVSAAIVTAALSTGTSYLFCASRILRGLAVRGQAPRFLLYTTKGLPLAAVLVSVRLPCQVS